MSVVASEELRTLHLHASACRLRVQPMAGRSGATWCTPTDWLVIFKFLKVSGEINENQRISVLKSGNGHGRIV